MKRAFILIMMGFVLGFLPGCDLDDNDSYSVENSWIGFGLVHKTVGADNLTILMDDGEVLYPIAGSLNELKDKERILTNFTILGNKDNENHDEEYIVRINSYRKILYKGILEMTPAMEDSIGNDPIKVKDRWVKNNMLNFELQYYGGEKIHYINLVKKIGITLSESEPIVLELRHNENKDSQSYPLSAIVTFDLSSLKVEGKNSIAFKVVAKDFDGKDFEYSGEYKY